MAMILDPNNQPDHYNSQMQRLLRGQTQFRWRRDGRTTSASTKGGVYSRSSIKRDDTNQTVNLSPSLFQDLLQTRKENIVQKVRNSHLVLISCREEFKSGEAVDFDWFDLIGSGVHLCHNDVSAVLKLLAKLIPDGSQLFAVSTPRCIWNVKKREINKWK